MALRDFGKHIRRLPRAQLIKDLTHLYKKYPAVREYYDQLLDPNAEERLLQQYKKIVRNEFFPTRGFGQLHFSVATNAVREFRKLRVSKRSIADLLLSYAENGAAFTREYGDIDERFYNTIERKFDDALTFMREHDLLDVFQDRAAKVVHDAEDCGWGFYDSLSESYHEHYGTDPD